jgi:hypothetical protein
MPPFYFQIVDKAFPYCLVNRKIVILRELCQSDPRCIRGRFLESRRCVRKKIETSSRVTNMASDSNIKIVTIESNA